MQPPDPLASTSGHPPAGGTPGSRAARAPSREVLLDYAQRIEADLLTGILPFWRTYAISQQRAGLVGELDAEGRECDGVERGMLLTARILWTFSAGFSRYGSEADRLMAEVARAELRNRFSDSTHGGFIWSIRPDSTPAQTRKQIYGQAFAIYALAEYHAATGRDEALARAMQLFGLIEKHARDAVHGGYIEAFAADWAPIADVRLSAVDLNEPKSQNTHLHLMEGYARLLRCRWDDQLHNALAGLIELMLTRILQPDGHLGLFFARDWSLRSAQVSYGHDIEAAWLLMDAARAVGDPALLNRTRKVALELATVTLREGIDADGGVFNAGTGGLATDTNKEWWPQAEAVVGFLEAYEQSDDLPYLTAALRAWDFIEARLIDRTHGEWFRGVTREGNVLPGQPKVSFWKCPYHNGRAALEAVSRLRRLAAR